MVQSYLGSKPRLSAEKQKVILMKDRVRDKVHDCDPIAVKMLDTTTSFLEDIFNNKIIGPDDYNSMRHQLTTLATKYANTCSCTKKKSNF